MQEIYILQAPYFISEKKSSSKWKEGRKAEPSSTSSNLRATDIMSSELPPIDSAQPPPLARSYSRDKLAANDSPPNGVIRHQRDRPPLISVDCSPLPGNDSQLSPSPYSPTRRSSRVSPGSQHSSSSRGSRGYSSQQNAVTPQLSGGNRNKSWATLDSNVTAKQPLETVVEQRRSSSNNVVTNQHQADSGHDSFGPFNVVNSSILNHCDKRGGGTNNRMKPPKERRDSSLINVPLANRRNTSTSNLTDSSANGGNQPPSSAIGSLKKPIQRIRSETNVLSPSTTTSQQQQRAHAQNSGPTATKRTAGLSRNKSVPVFATIETDMNSRNNNTSKRGSNKLKQSASEQRDDGDDSFDSSGGGDSKDRIVQWLLGVEKADTPPPSDDINDDPVQTDTAIHVVYNGD